MAEEQKQKSICVAVDFGECGAVALRTAHELATRYAPSELHVVHVLASSRDVGKLSDALSETMAQLQAHVTTVLAEIDAASEAPIAPVGHVRIGSPARAIHQCAIDVHADLIVVGSHNRRGLERVVLGSVSEELLRLAHAPVVVARSKDYAGLRESDRPEPPRPGQDMHEASLTERLVLGRPNRTSHIPGLL